MYTHTHTHTHLGTKTALTYALQDLIKHAPSFVFDFHDITIDALHDLCNAHIHRHEEHHEKETAQGCMYACACMCVCVYVCMYTCLARETPPEDLRSRLHVLMYVYISQYVRSLSPSCPHPPLCLCISLSLSLSLYVYITTTDNITYKNTYIHACTHTRGAKQVIKQDDARDHHQRR